MKKAIALYLILFALACIDIQAQVNHNVDNQGQKHFSEQQLKDDLTQIIQAIKDYHPNLYQFTKEDEFDTLYQERLQMISHPMTAREFYLIAAPIVAAVNCGHTRLSVTADFWSSQPDRFFPLQLKLLENGAFVTGHYTNESQIQSGSELLTINGIPVSEIISSMSPNISSDGYINTWKNELMSSGFYNRYALQFGFPEKFVVKFRPLDSILIDEVTMDPVDRQSISDKKQSNESQTSTGDPSLDFKILKENKTAVMTIKDFAYYQDQDKFYSFVDSSFLKIKINETENLIIDVRDNTGGDPFCSTRLLSYLEPEPVPYFARVYPEPYEVFAEPTPRAENYFDKNLYVLINGRCFSTTGHFLAMLKYQNTGIFVGEETGGTYECNDASKRLNLNNTGLRLSVARMTFTTAVDGISRETGIFPDFKVQPDIKDIINKRDTVLEFTLGLINNR
ncbi:MAG: hypothetical protein GY863_12415 [bacterium]|nr:hypothetical protein [bacterium]